MMIKPAIGDQMSAQGIRKEDVEFDIAITKYLNAGGTIERAQERLRLAAEKMQASAAQRTPERGHSGLADAEHSGEANRTQPMPSGRLQSASPLPYPHSRTRRDLTVIGKTQDSIKKGYLILMKTSDGRAWGSVGWHELDGMDRDGSIARLIKSKVATPMDRFATLNQVLSDKQFTEIYNEAQKQLPAE